MRAPNTAILGASAALLLPHLVGCTLDPGGADAAPGSAAASSAAGTAGGTASSGDPGGAGGAGGTARGGAGGVGGDAGAPVTPKCGNSAVESDEQCDDGNTASGDGCSSDCDVECSGGSERLHPTTLHCYSVHLEQSSWPNALEACKAVPGWDLAALTPSEEIDFLEPLLPDTHFFWIGGNDLRSEGTFEWTNGEPWIYQDGELPWFDSAEPNNANGGEHCVRTLPDGRFNDDQCDTTFNSVPFGFVCERPPAGL